MSDTPEWCPDVVDLGHTDCEVCEQARRRAASCERCAELEQAVNAAWYALNKVDNILTIAVTEADERLNERQLRPALYVIERARLRARQGENDAVDS